MSEIKVLKRAVRDSLKEALLRPVEER